jgi:rhodanese-related sulfurtransferase
MMEDITIEELKQKIDNQDDFLLIDVREDWEYNEFNINAKLIPL